MPSQVKTVLVTGAAGYIGSILTRLLIKKGYKVIGLDNLLFSDQGIKALKNNKNFSLIKEDIRKIKDFTPIFKNVDAIVHLAAIVGDPACSKEPMLAKQTNWVASRKFFNAAKRQKNIKRFIFASTCSNYGKMKGDGYLDENSPLKPVSLYAELKVKFEIYLLKSKTRPDFIPIALRFATAYGLSPRMRFDLTVNEFTRDIASGKKLTIYGEQFWRPYCHVKDLAKACLLTLEAKSNLVDHHVFNVGDSKENYTKKMLAGLLLKIDPKAEIEYIHKSEDPRDYKVDFSKINDILKFKTTTQLDKGIKEVFDVIKTKKIGDSYSPIYQNI